MCLAIPGQVVELAPGGHLATVEVSKVRRTINIDLLEDEPPAVGDWVLIHVGFAMSRISAEHAQEQLRLLAMLGEDGAGDGGAGRLPLRGQRGPGGVGMKYVDEFRDPHLIRQAADEIRRLADPARHYRIMEVCGGHTHAIYRFALADLLPAEHRADSRPGLPGLRAADGADRRGAVGRSTPTRAILTTFGDVMRVPGRQGSPLERKARGADIRMVYSPLDALKLATDNPDRHVVFFAIGFETTAPSTALTLPPREAARRRELLRLLQPRHDHPGDPRDPRFARHAARRVHRPRPRLHGDRLPAVRLHRARLRQADRDRRLRAARPAAVDRDDPAAAARRPGGGREPVRPRGAVGGQSARAARRSPRSSSCGPTSSGAASGFISQSALQLRDDYAAWDTERRFVVPGVRVTDPKAAQCGEVLKGRAQAAPVQAVRPRVHARAAGRRADGVVGGRLRRLLQLRPSPRRRAGVSASDMTR